MSLHSWRLISSIAVLLFQLGIEVSKAPQSPVSNGQQVALLMLLAIQASAVVASRSLPKRSRWIVLVPVVVEVAFSIYSTWSSVSETQASGTTASQLNLSTQNSRDVQILVALLAAGLASFRSKEERIMR